MIPEKYSGLYNTNCPDVKKAPTIETSNETLAKLAEVAQKTLGKNPHHQDGQ